MKWITLLLIIVLTACIPQTGGEPTPPAGVELEGTRWVLESIGDTPVVPGSEVTLQFDADNQAGGNASCNSYGGTYTLTGSQIAFTDIVSTLMACADESMMEQETAYLGALNSAQQVSVEGNRLTISYDGGQLNFVRAEE
jgi:heat shock protein HslJ